jgi:hypothetical protein
MDTWESVFRQKSRRRSRHRSRQAIYKFAVLTLLAGSVAAATYFEIAGLPR